MISTNIQKLTCVYKLTPIFLLERLAISFLLFILKRQARVRRTMFLLGDKRSGKILDELYYTIYKLEMYRRNNKKINI